jgi:NAD-dependent SIR2 family protein deacetylase
MAGRSAGVWPPLKAMNMDLTEMSCPSYFSSDPRLAWAFWHYRHQAYTNGTPHDGYRIIAEWGLSKPMGIFSVTSNVDGHLQRTPGVGPEKVLEFHSAVTHMQCLADDGRIWATDAAQIEGLDVPSWNLVPGEEVEIVAGSVLEDRTPPTDENSWTRAVVGDDGATLISCDGSGVRIVARAVRRPGGRDLMRVAEGCALPTCSVTGSAVRPNVFMFGDWINCGRGFNCGRIDEQRTRFNAWVAALPPSARLAVVEVGAGKAFPTIRRLSEQVVAERAAATLVRINLDDADCPADLQGRCVSVGGAGALAALQAIQERMAALATCCKGDRSD